MTAARRLHLPGPLRRLPFWRTFTVIVVAALVGVGVFTATRGGSKAAPSSQGGGDNRTLLGVLEKLDPSVVRSVGAGGLADVLVPVDGAPRLVGSEDRPKVVFMADEGCAACAAQRWSMVIALGRFGSMADLRLAASSANEDAGPLATFTFRSLQYASQYVDVFAVETADPTGAPLAALSPQMQQLVATYDAPPYVPPASRGGVPWLDVANRYVMSGSGYPPEVIGGLNWAQIAQRLANPHDAVTRAIVGNANWITAGICRATGMAPASVCNTATIRDLAARLG